jgi:hypothetical protein
MPRILEAEEFSSNARGEVADFFCGSEPWELAIADWIKATSDDKTGALWSMKAKRTKVWIYYDGISFVGYGSLGETNWSWPYPDGERKKVSIIPCLGLALAFQGEPKESLPKDRFSGQIIRHLTYHAIQQGHQFLVLKVHRKNDRAIRLYERWSFTPFPVREGDYVRMFKQIIETDRSEPTRGY